MFGARSVFLQSRSLAVVGRRSFASSTGASRNVPNGSRGAWFWVKGLLSGVTLMISASGLYSYYRLKRVLTLKRYLTEEEVETSRRAAQQIIADHDGNLTPAGIASLGPNMMVPYIPLAIQREQEAGQDVRYRKSEEGAAEAKEILGAAFSSDKNRVIRAGLNFLLYMVYSPDQLDTILRSGEAQKRILSGKLLTGTELMALRERIDETRWDDA